MLRRRSKTIRSLSGELLGAPSDSHLAPIFGNPTRCWHDWPATECLWPSARAWSCDYPAGAGADARGHCEVYSAQRRQAATYGGFEMFAVASVRAMEDCCFTYSDMSYLDLPVRPLHLNYFSRALTNRRVQNLQSQPATRHAASARNSICWYPTPTIGAMMVVMTGCRVAIDFTWCPCFGFIMQTLQSEF